MAAGENGEGVAGGGAWSRRDLLRRSAGLIGVATVPALASGCSRNRADAAWATGSFAGLPTTDLGPGGWCWFQDPRVSLAPGGILWLGTTVAHTYSRRDGAVELTALDLETMKVVERRTLDHSKPDDHISPSVLAVDGGVQVAWSLHKNTPDVRVAQHRIGRVVDVTDIRRPGALVEPARGTAYASAHVVGGQRWLLYRGEQYSWNLLTSPDGDRWTHRGLVVAPGSSGQRPYLSASGDGATLQFVVTDGNPEEYRGSSAYAGSIDADLGIHDSGGRLVGAVGSLAPRPGALTRLVAGHAGPIETGDRDVWLCDVQVVGGRPSAILSVRERRPDGDRRVKSYRHRYLWARWGPEGWAVEPLSWGGNGISSVSADYTGLASLHPGEPERVVVSTDVHPNSGRPLLSAADHTQHFELFEGRRRGHGSWTWTPVTENSSQDNIRPVVAADAGREVLAWMGGKYWSWTDFDTHILVRHSA
ncbi:MAG: hypothetical protein ACR2MB_00885 [Acidimicrobiales bacterium]